MVFAVGPPGHDPGTPDYESGAENQLVKLICYLFLKDSDRF